MEGAMATYIILSRFAPDAFQNPKEIKELAASVKDRIKKELPSLEWKGSYFTIGRYDVVDLVESDDVTLVEKAALIIRGYGHSLTETMLATPWKDFLDEL